MSLNLVTLLYLVASICFIQALKGLATRRRRSAATSSAWSAWRSPRFTTAALIVKLLESYRLSPVGLGWILLGLVVGGGYGAWRAQDGADDADARAGRVLPQHDRHGGGVHRGRRGGRAVRVRHRRPAGGGRRGRPDPDRQPARADPRRGDRRDHLQRLGDRLGQALGQVQDPRLPGRAGHLQGPALAQPRARDRDDRLHRRLHAHREPGRLLPRAGDRLPARRADHHPDRRRRHAGRRLDAQQLLGLGRGRHRLLAQQLDADHRRLAGRLVGRDPQLHHVPGDEPLVLQRHPRRLRRRGGRRRQARPSSGR